MKVWKTTLYASAVLAGIVPAAFSQATSVPAVGAAGPAAPAAAAPAGPTNNLWTFLCPSPAQKAACKEAFCNSAFGQLINNSTMPMSFMSGGLIPSCCPAVDPAALDPTKTPPDSAEGTAARIKQDEANAKKRRAAVRYLGTVDCSHYRDAKKALIGALREDPNECVRYEAALALGNGCCCNKDTIYALTRTVAGDDLDKRPRENCERVRVAAVGALEHCLACYVEVTTPAPVLERGREGEPLPRPQGEQRPRGPESLPSPQKLPDGAKAPDGSSADNAKAVAGRPATADVYESLQSVSIEKVVSDARLALEKVTHNGMRRTNLALREHSLTEIVRVAATGPATAGNAGSPEPPQAVAKPEPQKPVHVAVERKPAEFHIFSFSSGSAPAAVTATASTSPATPTNVNVTPAVAAKPTVAAKAVTDVKPAVAEVSQGKQIIPAVASTVAMPMSAYGMNSTAPQSSTNGTVGNSVVRVNSTTGPTSAVSQNITPAPAPAPKPQPQQSAPTAPSPVPPPPAHPAVSQVTPAAPRITLDSLLAMLTGKNADDRQWAATQLSILPAQNNPRVVRALMESTRDPEPAVRIASLRSLVSMHAPPNEVYAVAVVLLRDPDGRVRIEAYEDLRRIGVVR
jgi:hypothetical protein